jgi:hypothetical protein
MPWMSETEVGSGEKLAAADAEESPARHCHREGLTPPLDVAVPSLDSTTHQLRCGRGDDSKRVPTASERT